MALPQKGAKLHPNCIKNNFPTPINLLQVLPITQNIISDHFLKKKISGQIWPKVWPARRAPTHVLFDFDRFARVVFPTCKAPNSTILDPYLNTIFRAFLTSKKFNFFSTVFKFGQDLPAAKNPVFRGALVLDISAVRRTDTVTNWDYYIDFKC